MTEVYPCKICNTEIDWEGADDIKGTIWSCEENGCGDVFCRSCFVERYNIETFFKMVNEDDIIRCPDCYERMTK